MASKPGVRPPNAGKGRPKGSLNKTTKLEKEIFSALYDEMTGKLREWIHQVADGIKEAEPVLDDNGQPSFDEKGEPKVDHNWLIRPDPHGAAKLALEAIEFHRPKLARTEHTGEGGGAVKVHSTLEFVTSTRAVSGEDPEPVPAKPL